MRVWHSPWSWLNEIVALDSVAGNTLIGMFTRLILRKPFQVARAAITVCSPFVAFLMITQIQTGSRETDFVVADFVAEEVSRRPAFVPRHDEATRKITQARDDDQRRMVFPLAPADAAYLAVRNERRVGPYPVFVEGATDSQAQRHQVRVVGEHHRLAERLHVESEDLQQDQETEDDADGQFEGVVRRLLARPGEKRRRPAPLVPRIVDDELDVRDEEPRSEQQQKPGEQRLNLHGSIVLNLFDGGEMRVEAVPAARFVHAGGADEDAVAAGDEALRVVRRIAADDADGERLGDVFGNREQLRHRLEGTPEIILIEAGDDDPLAAIRERIARPRQTRVEELPLVDSDDVGVVVDAAQQLVGVADVLRRDSHVAVRDDLIFAEAVVDERLEDLNLLAGDLRATQPADQLLALAAEHAAGDDFDPAVRRRTSDFVHQTRAWYSPVSVLTRTLSPSLMNGGTCTTSPVSSVAGFTCALAVAPLMPGTVSLTTRSTVCGSSMPTGSLS